MDESKRAILTFLLVFVAVGASFIAAAFFGPERTHEIAETFKTIFYIAAIIAALILLAKALIKRKQ